ncbi:zinc ribbon domain-containing protein [Thermococcus sp.]
MAGEKTGTLQWRCPKCGSTEYVQGKVAMTGAGLSRLLDWQSHEFITITCKNCGYTEFYSADVVGGKDNLMKILDLIFGG